MKRKFSKILGIGLTLALLASLLVMATPVAALTVSTVVVAPDTINAAAKYTVTIITGQDLSDTADDDIRIEFPDDTTVPATYVNNSISINGTDVDTGVEDVDVDIVGRKFTIDVPEDVTTGTFDIIFKIAAGILNPSTTGDYKLTVSTSRETAPVESGPYTITAPTITLLQPASGNVGDTMWVEVSGDTFEGDAATNVSDTVINFGTGIEVLQTKYVETGEIDCQIKINTAGSPTVTGVAGGTGVTFTANIEGTPQVDVWETYLPTTDIFVAGTLIPEESPVVSMSYDTIKAAVDACDATETVIVHADTYVLALADTPLAIDEGITLQSLSGAAATTIDVSEAQETSTPNTSIGIEVTATGVTITGFTIIGVPTVTDSDADGFTPSSSAYPTIKATTGHSIVALTVQDCIFNAPSGEAGHAALLVDIDVEGVNFLDNEVTNYIFGVTAKTGVDDLIVEGNTFNQSTYLTDPDWYDPTTMYVCEGVQLWSGTRLVVKDNTFTGPATLAGEWGKDVLWNIFAIGDYNDWYGPPAGGESIDVSGNTISNYSLGIKTLSGGDIEENEIDGCTVGIQVGKRSGLPHVYGITGNLAISQNDITNSLNRGIWVAETTDSYVVTVKYNTIAGNANYGLTNELMSGTATAGSATSLTDTSLDWVVESEVGFVARGVLAGDRVVNVTTGLTATVDSTPTDAAPYTLAVTADNPTAGFTFSAGDSYRVEAKVNVDFATHNWWGHIGGPSADTGATAPLGSGDVLSSQMDAGSPTVYDPWLTEPQATVIADGVRSYGSDAILLEKGWNTLSVPCGLKTTADQFGEIELLGDFLTSANSDIGYWYDTQTSDWKLIDGSTELEPGKGFYVQMKAASRFPVLYFDGMVSLPAFDMYEGWNLIGSAFGIDKDDETANDFDEGDYGVAAADGGDDGVPGESDDDVESHMDTDDALASLGAAYSVVVSPSVPGQFIAWSEVAGDNIMVVGEAYWVFMTADGTLAGFEVTPFCFEPGAIPTP